MLILVFDYDGKSARNQREATAWTTRGLKITTPINDNLEANF